MCGQWKRPDNDLPDPAKDNLLFQQLDIDHYEGKKEERVLFGNMITDNTTLPIMRVYGIMQDETSVMIHVHGFMPYFYIKCGSKFRPDLLDQFKKALNDMLMSELKQSETEGVKAAVMAIIIEDKESMYGFTGTLTCLFLPVP